MDFISRAIAMFSSIVASFKKTVCGTIAKFFCQFIILDMSINLSSIKIFPSEGLRRPEIIFTKVLFPEPVGPLIAILSPFLISKLNLLSIFDKSALYLKERFSNFIDFSNIKV